MQHRIELSTVLLIAVRGKKNKALKYQPKFTGMPVDNTNSKIVMSNSLSIDASGRILAKTPEAIEMA